ncbi:uncharacterized protein BP01DRAFT_423242 [Aspergillus saccharolyticus JOP 1030-1]|uniref:Uncharacterized protein n=1 Tax=Aspergillus saccharolyticus JOP 1030-1 TaxID=1450539 RepID=A0A318ZFG8_9EURO|nr:hypothetical protein BP01DRAFT_423242 [Aspergillus saccharolyticus JOP 1030-1]PYH45437.1 hypothetical protein BP01DRAFT_423242 [Aspergillus saccharolyticus JOP 1030-1]
MAKSARRGPKAKSSTTPSSASGSGTSTPASQSSMPLPPFTKAPTTLLPLLTPLSPHEIYLLHIDTTPISLKKKTFLVPVLMNLAIVALLAYRVYSVRHIYPAMFASVIGLTNSLSVDTSALSWGDLSGLVLGRIFTVMLDYFLVTVLLPWPIRFLVGPVQWRRRVGFRDQEIIIRRSQASLTQGLKRDRWIREDEATRDRIVTAVTPEKVRKTGYLLVDKDWDLDYDSMIAAHAMVDAHHGPTTEEEKDQEQKEAVKLDEYRTAVVVNTDAHGWLIWRVEDENPTTASNKESSSSSSSTSTSKKVHKGKGKQQDEPSDPVRSAQRDQIIEFQQKLTAMGKEDLFYRWIELIQYESTQPGGFTPERQVSAMKQVKQLFEENDVDFDKFWEDVGGMEEEFTEQLD